MARQNNASVHRAAVPREGRNALDSATRMDVGWGLIRQQMVPSQRSPRSIFTRKKKVAAQNGEGLFERKGELDALSTMLRQCGS